ncbi:2-phosphosulfolactate phosphatase [Oceanobacillus zhaokaii]|uniref:Probable 2-phosphosulfolactate phosphatase n=1 Tax=Oceanobacillus zhaokaii TaxID=2052660 RepID=A0A345PJP8_9BACI|nr:2-phosphosulfolactate phosphatase [Oceanobacillus zhaokaii]AXI10228.1 2-phosphosulfolactate phosphatase [Oceanobacillus zhaokaii]
MKIHLLLKKEEIDTVQMNEDKIAVVFDVLLATSTITSCLDYGAKQVIPVMDEAEAVLTARDYLQEDIVLVGEYNGITIDGFLNPAPSSLKNQVKDKTVILSTTNGTVAIRKSATAKQVYIASLLNSVAVSKRIIEIYDGETIVVVCSGSSNQFCVEDFYGAGYFIEQLVKEYGVNNVDLTDSSMAAKLFYENTSEDGLSVLSDSRVGRMLNTYNLQDDLTYVSQKGILTIIPILLDGRTVVLEKIEASKEK